MLQGKTVMQSLTDEYQQSISHVQTNKNKK